TFTELRLAQSSAKSSVAPRVPDARDSVGPGAGTKSSAEPDADQPSINPAAAGAATLQKVSLAAEDSREANWDWRAAGACADAGHVRRLRSEPGAVATGSMTTKNRSGRSRDPVATAPGSDFFCVICGLT